MGSTLLHYFIILTAILASVGMFMITLIPIEDRNAFYHKVAVVYNFLETMEDAPYDTNLTSNQEGILNGNK